MGAVPYLSVGDVVRNMQFQCGVTATLDDLVGVLEDYMTDHPSDMLIGLTEHDRNIMLGIITGCTVATGTDLNCYPRGAETALFFDLDGNPVTP
jgi:hypothetical protein